MRFMALGILHEENRWVQFPMRGVVEISHAICRLRAATCANLPPMPPGSRPFPFRSGGVARPGPAVRAGEKRAVPENHGEDRPGKRTGPPRPKEINYITPAGLKRMTDELTFLRTKKRPEVVAALSDAAAEGDRSENAEYIYRKRQLREVDRRLRFLSKRLDDVQVVDPLAQTRTEQVFFGATVTVEDQEGVEHVYRIVGQDEVDGGAGEISWKSPVGRALLGKSLGDSVVVRWHAGTRELTVAAIAYEAAPPRPFIPS
jgi:transcription elongation factor GreB